uniref:Uncharacterized protein n=1 Tax=Daphnia galeata TaxID=27404 RepID=A0A8J2RC82_9CRUS|nr:unnamed protein product [Daphnia galeata]
MRFLFPFLILGLVFLVGGAYSNSLEAVKAELANLPSNRINSGVPVSPGEFPSVIAIFWYGSFRCSGTLIGPYHVLIGVLFGLDNDIAIVVLNSPITNSAFYASFRQFSTVTRTNWPS